MKKQVKLHTTIRCLTPLSVDTDIHKLHCNGLYGAVIHLGEPRRGVYPLLYLKPKPFGMRDALSQYSYYNSSAHGQRCLETAVNIIYNREKL